MFGKVFRSKDYGFFELFEKHAAATVEGAAELQRLATDFAHLAEHVSRLEEIEHQCDTYAHMVVDLLHKTFITPLDRDEIMRLISGQDDMMDAIQLVGRRLLAFEVRELPAHAAEMVVVIGEAIGKVAKMVTLIRDLKQTDLVRELAKEVHTLENKGDQLFAKGLSELFRTRANDPICVIKLKEVLEILELAIDRCETVSNTIEGIFLEHG